MIIIERKTLYGHGNVELRGIIANGVLVLRQDSTDHDYRAGIQIDTLEALEKLAELVAEAKQQLEARNQDPLSLKDLCFAQT